MKMCRAARSDSKDLSGKVVTMGVEEITRVAVVGSGLMGHGIALQFALGGYDVMLNDISEERLEQAVGNVKTNLALLQSMGLVDDRSADAVPGRIRTGVSMAEMVDEADFVVEAVFEDLALKRSVFADLDRLAPERTILSSNTSSFMSSQLASATGRPDKVVVANWWNPPYLLPLVEVVRGPETSNDTIETTTALLTKAGKRPVVLQKESLGFIGNRMQFALLREAVSIVERGIASAEDVDAVVTNSFGRRLAVAGPLEVFDLAGWDTILAIIDQLFPDLESSGATPTLVRDMVARGNLGVKSGQGFYDWTDDAVATVRQRVGRALAAIEQLPREE